MRASKIRQENKTLCSAHRQAKFAVVAIGNLSWSGPLHPQFSSFQNSFRSVGAQFATPCLD